MRSKHVCPNCGGKEFYTIAHVAEEWKVNEFGTFLGARDVIEVDAEPDDENCWWCTRCGKEGVIVKE